MNLTNRWIRSSNVSAGFNPLLLRPFNIVFDLAVVIVLLNLFLGSWYVVSTGEVGVVTRTGAVVRDTEPGLGFKLPFVESVHKISTMTQSIAVKDSEGGTHDLQTVHTSLTVKFHILPKYAAFVYGNLSRSGDMDPLVETATAEAFKSVTAFYTATNLVQQRNQVSRDVVNAIQKKIQPYGLKVVNVDMTKFAYDENYMKQINLKVQETEKLATQRQVLERIKVEEQQNVVKARARAEATEATATAEANALVSVANAKATAIAAEGKALRDNPAISELRRIEVDMVRAKQWKGDVPTHMYGSAPIPFVDTNHGAK